MTTCYGKYELANGWTSEWYRTADWQDVKKRIRQLKEEGIHVSAAHMGFKHATRAHMTLLHIHAPVSAVLLPAETLLVCPDGPY